MGTKTTKGPSSMTAHSLNIEPDEQIRQTIRRARAEREAEERRRVLKLVAPSALPKADELNRLAKAERKMADPKRRQDGAKERDDALIAYRSRVVTDNDRRRRDEIEALIKSRGDEIIADTTTGTRRLRILSHDGLMSLYEGEKITGRQKEAGLLFRAAYEVSQPPPKVASYGDTIRGHGDAGAAAARRALADRRRLACLGFCRNLTERMALERIAGEGRTVRSMAAGRTHAKVVEALSRVLSRIADRYI